MIQLKAKKFSELDLEELYTMLQLRATVFVVEQNCVYQDVDGKDKDALHILGYKSNELIAYSRVFPPGIYFEEPAIGRVLVKQEERSNSYGHDILEASVRAIETRYKASAIKLSAQVYLKAFYEAHGFESVGESYLEDDIPHIAMLKKLNNWD